MTSSPKRHLPQASTEKTIALRLDIAQRYARDDRQRRERNRPRLFARLRLRELERFYAYTYGPTLPDDDAGRAEFFNAAMHLAEGGSADQRIRVWASAWCPWMSDEECSAEIERVAQSPARWKADTLAWRIGLDDASRTLLDIRTIGATDCGKAARARRRKKANAAAHKARRKAAARPTIESAQPWKARGISRATWYRRQRETVRQNLSAIKDCALVEDAFSLTAPADVPQNPAKAAAPAAPPSCLHVPRWGGSACAGRRVDLGAVMQAGLGAAPMGAWLQPKPYDPAAYVGLQ